MATGFLYHFPVHELAEKVLRTIRREGLIKPGDRVAVAVSGGGDSVALLFLLLELQPELGIVLSVAHVNHRLRGEESEEDERFVRELAGKQHLELHAQTAPLDRARDSGIEAAARKLRYDFFRQLAREGRVSKIATAHTLDDQAETVLLRILRGTGIRGLSGIHSRLSLTEKVENIQDGKSDQSGGAFGEVIRPLLGFRRAELQGFLRQHGHGWREDSSNRDLGFLRNRVRHILLPVLQENFGEAVFGNLADLAEIARAEEEQWQRIQPDVRSFGIDAGKSPSLALEPGLLSFPLAARRRVIRAWLDSSGAESAVSFRLIEEILDLARGPTGKKLELPGGRVLRRTKKDLCLELSGGRPEPSEYEYRLPIPGQIEVVELGVRIEAFVTDRENVPEDQQERLLDPTRMPQELVVRNWRPGDRFWPAHTKAAKKVKQLLSDRHLTGRERALWPVVVAEKIGLVWMRGFAVPAGLRPPSGSDQVLCLHETKTT